jgi:pre-mRNA-splicing factor CDC5/CEF1
MVQMIPPINDCRCVLLTVQALREELRMGLAQLPAPRRDFDIVAPEEPEDEEAGGSDMVPDAADAAADLRRQRAAAAAAELARRSRVVQRGLPVPNPGPGFLRSGAASNAEQEADELVKREMLAMIEFDRGAGTLEDDVSAAEMEAAKVRACVPAVT